METSRKIVITIALIIAALSVLFAFNVLALDCPEGSKLMPESVTSNGSVRKAHCRKAPKKLTKEEKVAKLNALKKERPDLSKQIDDKIKKLN